MNAMANAFAFHAFSTLSNPRIHPEFPNNWNQFAMNIQCDGNGPTNRYALITFLPFAWATSLRLLLLYSKLLDTLIFRSDHHIHYNSVLFYLAAPHLNVLAIKLKTTIKFDETERGRQTDRLSDWVLTQRIQVGTGRPRTEGPKHYARRIEFIIHSELSSNWNKYWGVKTKNAERYIKEWS